MNTTALANSILLDETAPSGQWIQMFPAGAWVGHDGRGPYHITDAEAVIAASKRAKTDLVIDRDHEKFNPNKKHITAAGWIKDFAVRDGEIWAYVEWTKNASYQLKNKEYRYFSPEFTHDGNGHILKIMGGSLTNTPNFELEAVASMQNDIPFKKENHAMDDHMKKLALLLGLADTATADDVVTAAQKNADALADATSKVATLEAQVATAAQKLEAASFDATRYVPVDDYKVVCAQLEEQTLASQKSKVDGLIDSAVKAGKIAPASRDHYHAMASQDFDACAALLKVSPEIIPTTQQKSTVFAAATEETGLTAEEKQVCASMNLSEEDFKKYGSA